mmetsp:Transcript_24293/g.37504  ORF Transcript_24293/g.37504 Transcript_24293/m.37504 type:complete len:132 (+) Transcript_24293:484-879(+)
MWTSFIILLTILSSVHYAALAAFRHQNHNDSNLHFVPMLIYEVVFLLDLILHFFVDFINKETGQTERDLSKIGVHYLKTRFVWNFFPLLPLQLIELCSNRHNLFYLIKVLRLAHGLSLIDTNAIMQILKKR